MDYLIGIIAIGAIIAGMFIIVAACLLRELRKDSRLITAACRHAHELISYNWETEEEAIEWLMGHRTGALGRFLNSPTRARLLSDDYDYDDLNETLLKEFVLGRLARSSLIECDITFWTKEKVQSEWNKLMSLSAERRSRFEVFLHQNSEVHSNRARIIEWLNSILSSSEAELHVKRVEDLMQSGMPILPVLRVRKRHARVTSLAS